jgi:hypothetical protein
MDDFEAYIAELKAAVRIEDVIGKDEALKLRDGRFMRGAAHDSLVVDTERGLWYWNSRGEHGDVIQWLQDRRGMDFKTAVEYLAGLAGIESPAWGRGSANQRLAAQARYDALTVAARHFVRILRASSAAQAYCAQRGWTEETVHRCGLGFWDGNKKAFRDAFSLHEVPLRDPVVRALVNAPAAMLVYPHVLWGKVRYVSMRSIEGKRHWNPPVELVGERQPMWSVEARPGRGDVVVVEGQADVVTLTQWGIPAVGLAGVSLGNTEPARRLLRLLGQHDRVYVGLDADDAGWMGIQTLARALKPTIHVLQWPDHDANDWLRATPERATAAAAHELMEHTPTFVELYAERVGAMSNSMRVQGLRDLMRYVNELDQFERAEMRTRLATAANLGLREFDGLLRVAENMGEGGTGGEGDEDEPLVKLPLVGGLVGDYLIETIYRPPEGAAGAVNQKAGVTKLVVRDPSGAVQVKNYADIDGVRYLPIDPDSAVLTEQVVRFAPELGAEMSTRDLVRTVQHTIHKYVDVDVFYETLSSYYVLFTWLYDAFNTLPYLRMIGDAGTGKSRFLQVVGSLCYRPIIVSGAATTSPIFRLLHAYRGTLVLDESDFGQSDEAADIVKILNTGYQRAQGIVLRAGPKENGFDPEVFVVYGPKLLAGRKRFADWAVESRCLVKEMGGPTVREDIPIELPREFWRQEVPKLQGLLLRYRMTHWKPEIELRYEELDATLEPRLNQVMLALVSLVDDPDLREDLRGFMRAYNEQLISERGLTLTARCLEAIVAQHEHDGDLSLKMIAKRMNQLIDWENLNEGDLPSDTTKRIKPRGAGKIARTDLQFRTGRNGSNNGRYEVEWDEQRVNALRKRYGIDDDRLRDVLQAIYDMEARELDARNAAAQQGFGGN